MEPITRPTINHKRSGHVHAPLRELVDEAADEPELKRLKVSDSTDADFVSDTEEPKDGLMYEPQPKHRKISHVTNLNADIAFETDDKSYVSGIDNIANSEYDSSFMDDGEYRTSFETHQTYQPVSSRLLLVPSLPPILPSAHISPILKVALLSPAEISHNPHMCFTFLAF